MQCNIVTKSNSFSCPTCNACSLCYYSLIRARLDTNKSLSELLHVNVFRAPLRKAHAYVYLYSG